MDPEDTVEEIDADNIGENLSDEAFLQQAPSSVSVETPVEIITESEAEPEEGGDEPTDDEAVASDDGHTTPKQVEAKEGKPVAGEPTAVQEAPNYEELYKKVMAPFKANGKEFVPESPDEMIRLAQMGANYTKKMQGLAPRLSLMRMLEVNDLLDEGKLSFLIDVNKKDPKAIQKLLHDSKLDPLDLDAAAEPTYVPGNHRVSDQEMKFHDTLTDVASSDGGQATIREINDKWDQASKQAVYAEPQLLSIINEQRSNGIYDQINSEIERQRMLGRLTDLSFIQAYRVVGDELHNNGRLVARNGSPSARAATTTHVPADPVLETRTGAPKTPSAPNADKARAASIGGRGSPKSTKVEFDPFTMTDEQIMAISSPR